MKLNEEEEYNLIQADNDMAKVVHQLKTAGYEPFVKYQVGMISQVKAKFKYKQLKKTVHYNIMAQNLSKETVHSEVHIGSKTFVQGELKVRVRTWTLKSP